MMKGTNIRIKHYISCLNIDFTFYIVLAVFFLLDELLLFLIYYGFIILHELCHLFVAKRLGYLPKKLRLTAFGASLEGFDDFFIFDEFKIILAGPMFNLLVVVGCYLSFWFYPETFHFLNMVLEVNLAILFFNLIPIFPLDFGRILLALFSIRNTRARAVKIVKTISLLFVFVLFFLSVVLFVYSFSFSLGFASLNLCLLLFGSTSGTSFKREVLLHRKILRLNKGIFQKIIYVNENFSEELLLKFIDGEHYFIFLFVNKKFEVIKKIDECELLKKLGFI